MNSRVLTICLVGIGLLAAVWLVRTTGHTEGDTPSQDLKPALGGAQNRPAVASPASTEPSPPVMASALAVGSADPAEVEWIAQRSAGVVISQTQEGKLWYPGSIVVKGVTMKLGETPPIFHHQLEAKNCALLLGELDNRHRFQRHLRTVSIVSGEPEMKYGFSVSYPKYVTTQGGIVFRRSESVIHTVGIIIPDIKVPQGLDPSSPEWSVLIRMENDGIYIDPEKLGQIKPQTLDSTMVVLMKTHLGEMPSSARILWLEFDDNGSLVVGNR